MSNSHLPHLRLRLQFQDREIVLDERHPALAIGRAEDNDVIIKGNLISRLHARIEINRHKFVLVDQSTNGTFVQSAGGDEAFVRRDSVQIKGKGMIGLGKLARTGFAADDSLRLRGRLGRRLQPSALSTASRFCAASRRQARAVLREVFAELADFLAPLGRIHLQQLL